MYWQMSQVYKKDFIPLFKTIKEFLGAETTMDILKKASYENNRRLGARLAERSGTNDLSAFSLPFRNPDNMLNRTNIIEIVRDEESTFELRITACLAERVFREENACDIGFAAVCSADYALPMAFNPKLRLIRDRTLMQGHACCNHTYVMTS